MSNINEHFNINPDEIAKALDLEVTLKALTSNEKAFALLDLEAIFESFGLKSVTFVKYDKEDESLEIHGIVIVDAFGVKTTLDDFSFSKIDEFFIKYGGVTDPLGQLASAVMNFIDSAIARAKSAILGAIDSITSTVRNIVSGIKSAVSSAISSARSAILSAIRGIQSSVQSIVSSLGSTIRSVAQSIQSAIQSAISSIASQVQSIASTVSSSIQSLAGTIQSAMSSVVSSVSSIIQGAVSSIQSALTGVINAIQSVAQSIQSAIQSAITSIVNAVQNMAQSIANLMQSMVTQIQSALQSFVQSVMSGIQTVVTQIQNFATQIQNVVQSAIQGAIQSLQNIAQSITSTIQGVFSQIQSTLQGFANAISSAIKGVVSAIQGAIQSISNTLRNIFGQIQSFIQGVITKIVTSIQGFAQGFKSALQSFFGNISKVIEWVREKVAEIPQLPQKIWDFIKPFLEPIFNIIKDIPNKMAEIAKAFQGFINPLVGIAHFFDQIRQSVVNFFSSVINWVTKGWNDFVNWVKKIPDTIKNVIDTLKKIGNYIYDHAIKPLQDWLGEHVVKPLGEFKDHLINWITKGWENFVQWVKNIPENIKKIGSFIYEHAIKPLQDWLGEHVVKPLGEFKDKLINWITEGWNNFVNWIKGIPENLQKIGNFIYEHAIKPVQDWVSEHIIKPISDFLKPIIDDVKGFFKDPLGAIKKVLGYVVDVVKAGLEWLYETIVNVLSGFAKTIIGFLTGIITNVTKFFAERLKDFAVGLSEFTWGLVSGIFGMVRGACESVGKEIAGLVTSIIDSITSTWGAFIEEHIGKIFKKIESGESKQFIEMVELLGLTASGFILGSYLIYGLRQVLFAIGNWIYEKEVSLATGTRLGWKILLAPLDVGGEGEGDGEGKQEIRLRMSLGRTIQHFASELSKYPDEIGRALIYGWSIWLSQPMMRLANASFRNFMPVELPSLSEMRDIARRYMPTNKFDAMVEKMRRYLALYGYSDEVVSWLTTKADVEGWFITIKDRFNQDRRIPISLLYELPTPSDFVRMMIHDIIQHPDYFIDIMKMKGYVSDVTMMYYLLHYRYPTLEKLWEFYCRAKADMLWIDPNVLPEPLTPSEKDIVNKYKVGFLPKYPADFNVSKNSNAPQAIMDAIKQYAKWHDYAFFSWLDGFTSDRMIMLDLMADIPQRIDARWMYKWSLISDNDLRRIVIARGLHPKWVDTITVAEAMNALAEERTYARTGVLNAFKEGFMSFDNLKNTLSHLTDVKILGKNYPVRFLEGEVKLLALRAKYDRALDILRDYFRDLLRGVTENMMTFDNMEALLSKEISDIGNELGLTTLKLDDSYFKLYKPVAESLRKIRTIERIRYWYRYMLYRLLYRFERGYISKKEFNEIIDNIVKSAKLTDEEKKVFMFVSELMYDGFYKATLAEAILKKVSRGVLDPNKAKQELIKLGLDEQLAEAMIEKYAKLYTLSVSQLISYAEYVDIPEDYVKKKLEILGVPKDEIPIILQVFKIRPLRDEIAKMVRSVIDAYIDGYIDEKLFVQNLRNLGKSEREIQILKEFADFEKSQKTAKLVIDAILNKLRRGAITIEQAKRELSKYIVDKALIDAIIEKYVRTQVFSVDKLVSMGEYVPIDIKDIVEKAKVLGYPPEEIKILPAYAIARNLNEEIGRVVNELVYLYVYDVIDEKQLSKMIDEVRTLNGQVKRLYGVDWIVIDDMEKELIIQRAKLRKLREQARKHT